MQKSEWCHQKEQLLNTGTGTSLFIRGGGDGKGICLWVEKFWDKSYMLLTGELTKLGVVFNSEKEQFKFFSCYNYNYYYCYCFIYHYHYYYLTLISIVNFLHLEDQDLFSLIDLFFWASWVSFNVFLRDISSCLYYFHNCDKKSNFFLFLFLLLSFNFDL